MSVLLIIFVIVLVLLLIGGGVYFYLRSENGKKNSRDLSSFPTCEDGSMIVMETKFVNGKLMSCENNGTLKEITPTNGMIIESTDNTCSRTDSENGKKIFKVCQTGCCNSKSGTCECSDSHCTLSGDIVLNGKVSNCDSFKNVLNQIRMMPGFHN